MSKNTKNTTALKVQYLSCTNTKGSRVKFTQLNNNQTCIIPFFQNYCYTLDQVEAILDGLKEVISYNVILDNTQRKYYIIAFDFVGYSIPDLISEIKKLK